MSYTIVACWVDQNIGEPGSNLTLKERFKSVSDRITTWNYYDSTDQFISLIEKNPNAKVIAVMSGNFARTAVSLVSHLDNLHSVYVFCGNVNKYKNAFSTEPKVRGIFNDEDVLYNQMHANLKSEFP